VYTIIIENPGNRFTLSQCGNCSSGKLQPGFHLVERLAQLIGRDGPNNPIAIVALDVTLIAANDTIQKAATFWIAGGGDDALEPGAVTDGAVAGAGKHP
jgi:hypothetical protein